MIMRILLVAFVFSLLSAPVSAATGVPDRNNILGVKPYVEYCGNLKACVGFSMELRGDDRGSKSSHRFTGLNYRVSTVPEVDGDFYPSAGIYAFTPPSDGAPVKVTLVVEGRPAEITLVSVLRQRTGFSEAMSEDIFAEREPGSDPEAVYALAVGENGVYFAEQVIVAEDDRVFIGWEQSLPPGRYVLYLADTGGRCAVPDHLVVE